jgi:hypothetical protein
VGTTRFTQDDAERVTMQILASADCYTPSGKRVVVTLMADDIKKLFE